VIRKVVARQGRRVPLGRRGSIYGREPVVRQGKGHVDIELFGKLDDPVQTLDTICAGIHGRVTIFNEQYPTAKIRN